MEYLKWSIHNWRVKYGLFWGRDKRRYFYFDLWQLFHPGRINPYRYYVPTGEPTEEDMKRAEEIGKFWKEFGKDKYGKYN